MPQLLVLPLILAALHFMATAPQAGACGGTTPCACGDTVVAARVLVCGTDPVTTVICAGSGLTVDVGVTLDLGGCTIHGSGTGRGVSMLQNAGAVINGRITAFDTGVFGQDLKQCRVAFLHLIDNASRGLDLSGAGSCTVERNRAVRNGQGGENQGGFFIAGNDTLVRLNHAEGNRGVGFAVSQDEPGNEPGNTITRNIAHRNTREGFRITDVGFPGLPGFAAAPAPTTLNRAEFNGGDGFVFSGAHLLVHRNKSDRNNLLPDPSDDGVEVFASHSRFEANRFTSNIGWGILDHDTSNTYVNNICTGNGLGPSSPPGLCAR